MSRLIDANELIQVIDRKYGGEENVDDSVFYLIGAIIGASTVDAVPVVRCKDCKFWDSFPTASATPYIHECRCRYPRRGTSANDFCSWGERREDAE